MTGSYKVLQSDRIVYRALKVKGSYIVLKVMGSYIELEKLKKGVQRYVK